MRGTGSCARTLTLLTLMLLLSCRAQTQSPVPPLPAEIPAAADRYTFLIMGNRAGQQAVWTTPDGQLHIFFQFNDRGRGPQTTSILKLNANGLPIEESVRGNDYYKSRVDESYTLADAAPLTRDVRVSAYFWGLYLLVCLLSLAGHAPPEVLPYYRLLVEGMLMPALLGLYAMRYLPLLKDLQKLHICACTLGLGLCISGLVELTTDIDLFPWKESEPQFTDTHVRRADGPFEQQIVLSLVAILVFFFVIYLRRLMPDRISPWRTMIHKAGAVASFTAALLPLNRGLVLVLLPIAAVDFCSRHRLISRRTWTVFFAMVVLAAVAAKLDDPRLYDDRVARPDNLYQRLAQHRETLRVVGDYPLFGVGFGLYHDVAAQNPRYKATWKGIESVNFPHNVLMTVLSEEGTVGLLFYVLAQLFLLRAMWRIREAFPPGWLAFLYCFLAYVLIGLDYATVYFYDINLFYMFVLGVLYQVQIRMAREQELAVPISPNLHPSMPVLSLEC